MNEKGIIWLVVAVVIIIIAIAGFAIYNQNSTKEENNSNIAAWPVDTFVKANDFNGKTVIPFCTSASSGLGQSGKLLEREANSGNWEDGHRFNERPSDSDIKNWTDSL